MPAGKTVYETVAERIERLIEKNVLLPGDRIPSLRQMRRETGASVTSILQGYILLESRGLIESRPQSGFYVRPRLRPVPPPLPSERQFKEKIDEYVVQSFLRATTDPKVVQLAESTPCPDLMPTKHLCRLVGRICRDTPEKVVVFESPEGNRALRREIAKRGLGNPDEIVVTNGGYEAWNLCFRAVARPGDAILVESPTYFGVAEILRSLGLTAVEMPRALPEIERVLASGRVKAAFVLPQFTRPFGDEWSDTAKRALVETFSRYDTPVIEGDVYRDFYFGARPSTTLKSFDTRGIVLHCGSFSKTVSSGFRLAWIVPGRFGEEILRLKFLSSISAPTLSQIAIAKYLAEGSFDRHLRLVRKRLIEQMSVYVDAIARHFPEGTRVATPNGGFVLWAQLPEGVDSLAVYRRALAENIVIAPGPIFTLSGELRSFIRVSFGNRWSPRMEKAIAKVGAIARRETEKR